jgi:hypothetical protein
VTPQAQGAASAGDDLPSPLTAVDDMRATAKWTLAVVGAVGAALISGGPLVAVGQVHGLRDSVLAGIGLLCALAGVGLAIWFTSRVLMPRLTTPAVFTEQKTSLFTRKTSVRLAKLTGLIDNEPAYFFGELAASLSDLLARRVKTLDGVQKVAEAIATEGDPVTRRQLEMALSRLQSDLARIDACLRSLLPLAHAWQVEADLKRSRLWTLGGGVLVVAGAVLFFGVTGSSGPTYVPVVTTTPSATATAPPAPAATH